MFVDGVPSSSLCPALDAPTDNPIAGTVGVGGANRNADVLVVQKLLNMVSPGDGGPALLLAEDGICGPKTQGAIDGFQKKVLNRRDDRIDPGGPTIKALTAKILGSPGTPSGPLGLVAKGAAKGTPNQPTAPSPAGADIVATGISALKQLEPRLSLLRFRMARFDSRLEALMNKHFASGGDRVTGNEITRVQRILAAIHFQVARAGSFGATSFDSVVVFDPTPTTTLLGWTVRGGDKLSTQQFQIYVDNGKVIKAPGHTIFLTGLFATGLKDFGQKWVVLHECAHFVGGRDDSVQKVDDNAYAFEANFLSLSKFRRTHNAETLALFFLEWCIGTANILTIPRLAKFASHFAEFPKVVNGEIVTA